MRKMQRIACWSLLALIALATSGCFNRQLLGFQTHPEKDVMLMETRDTRSYLLWSNTEHVYWTCSENADVLSCSRRCGSGTDLQCPELSIFPTNASTNVR